MELVTERCDPGPVELPAINVDPGCGESDLLERLYDEAVCRTQYLDSMQEVVVRCGFHPNLTRERCAVNEMGRYCEATDNVTTALRDVAATNCADTTVCNPLCMSTLENITSCCLITKYNGTAAPTRFDWLSYEFWSLCGLDSPGFCELRFTEEPVGSSAVVVTAAAGVVSLMTALMVLAQH